MLWTIAVVLILLWLSGLVTGYEMGSFIHVLFVAAVALLVVSLSQEVVINQKLKYALYSRGQKQDSIRRRKKRVTDQPIGSSMMPLDQYPAAPDQLAAQNKSDM